MSHKEVEGVPVLSLTGDCDELLAAAARCIIQGYLGMGKKTLIFDLSKVAFVKPESYKVLEGLCRDIDQIQGRVILVGASAEVQEEFNRFPLKPGCLVASSTFSEALAMAKKIYKG
ncbi:MAG: STAS domain-containing protein [Candidatus Aquicultorales bacterium]